MRYYSDSAAYDAANQLIREDNGFINKTVTYTYDAWGNILTKSEYPYTTGTLGTPSNSVNYTYTNSAWGDQLTSYNGETITYDAMGNPVNYRGYATSFEGKQLVSAVKTGKNITFAYDENGLRTQKTVNNVTTNYYYNGSVLMSMTKGDTSLLFSYDAAGNVVAVEVQSDSWYIDGQTLYYIRNGQGDIMGLIDSSGRTVIEYRYDTWGKDCSYQPEYQEYLDLQELNPFRYRGYVYDTETGWYYLQSRYYDPATCRFISADILLSTGQGVLGHNTFAYCNNNPVNAQDSSGCIPMPTYNVMETDGGGGRKGAHKYEGIIFEDYKSMQYYKNMLKQYGSYDTNIALGIPCNSTNTVVKIEKTKIAIDNHLLAVIIVDTIIGSVPYLGPIWGAYSTILHKDDLDEGYYKGYCITTKGVYGDVFENRFVFENSTIAIHTVHNSGDHECLRIVNSKSHSQPV